MDWADKAVETKINEQVPKIEPLPWSLVTGEQSQFVGERTKTEAQKWEGIRDLPVNLHISIRLQAILE